MKTIHFSLIKIAANRQRQEFEAQAMLDLSTSIEERGLMHAVILREADGELVLVGGERRLKAMQDIWALEGSFKYDGEVIPPGFVPYTTMGDLDILEAEEAELDENLKRKDLTWQEHAAAVEKLHKLRGKQATAEAVATGLPVKPHTVNDTALELSGKSGGWYGETVRRELIVARNLSNPEVAKAKNVDEAFKVLKRTEATAANIALSAEVGKTFTASLHTALNANCLDWMANPANHETIDVILTDPPYGMGADAFSDGGGKLTGIDHQYDDSHESWKKLMSVWAPLSFAVAKPEAHAYVFCDLDRFHELKAYMQAAGWYVFRTPIIDYKTDSGRVPLPDRGPRRQWEMILYAIKGNKTVTHIYPDVIPCTADANMTHGAQKPVSLYMNLLKRSIKPGDVVLDTFSGSGTIFPACHEMQCMATGLEQNPAYYAMGLRRLKSLQEAVDPMQGLIDLVGEALL